MSPIVDIKSMTPEELAVWLKELGEPAFRAKQIFKWLYRGVTSFGEMTDLSKALRQKLEETALLTPPTVARKQESAQDGTIKYLWQLADATAWSRCSCATSTAIRCVSPARLGAGWGAPSAPPPSRERCGT